MTAVIGRYSPEVFTSLWSDQTKYDTWLQLELSACEAMEAAALVPVGTAARIRDRGVVLDAARINEIERTVKHDVIAFLTHVEELVGEDARWLHFGMTSSDVLDSSLALLLTRAADLLTERLDHFIDALSARVEEHRSTPMIGRSHGIHAEPTTFGMALASHLAEAKRGRRRLLAARREIAVGKIGGAVGSYAHLSPTLEEKALASLGLRAETVATQVVARDRHAAFFATLAIIAAAIERLATNIRHWQRNEVAEAEEPFTSGQKGSSAMPHKRNPIGSENLCGMARVVRAAVTPALENIALWHERDISHSSVERIFAPDATTALGYMLQRITRIVAGLVVYPAKLASNLALTGGRCFSEGVLLALVRTGMPRQQAYEAVQRAAMKAFRGEGEFPALLAEDPIIQVRLSAAELARCFSLDHVLRHTSAIIDRALNAP